MSETSGKTPLRLWRDHVGLSQQACAELVNTTQANWNRIENKRTFASPSLARRISDLTGIGFESLLRVDSESGVSK